MPHLKKSVFNSIVMFSIFSYLEKTVKKCGLIRLVVLQDCKTIAVFLVCNLKLCVHIQLKSLMAITQT